MGRLCRLLITIYSIVLAFLFPACTENPVNGAKPPCPPILIVPTPAYNSPVWHPGGEFIGFNHIPLTRIEYPFGEDCQGRLYFDYSQAGFWLINPDGTNKSRIFPYTLQSPAWSPDGEWIAFSAPVGSESHIFKMRFTGETFDTTTITQLTFEGRNFYPAWSPDGKWIVYDRSLADVIGPAGIWQMKSDGSSKKALFGGAYPAYHPSGNILLGVIGTSPTSFWTRFLRYDLNVSASMDTLSVVIGNDNRHPRYSPDGITIAFTSQPSGNKVRPWIMNADGSNVRMLIDESVDATFGLPFSWSPDGKYIVYTRYDSSNWSYENGVLWIINPHAGNQRQLTFNP